jgi:hypothetical protein
MPTNFGMRKKTIYSFKRSDKVKKKDDSFIKSGEQFFKRYKYENISIKS